MALPGVTRTASQFTVLLTYSHSDPVLLTIATQTPVATGDTFVLSANRSAKTRFWSDGAARGVPAPLGATSSSLSEAVVMAAGGLLSAALLMLWL
jgi:hypothetical protein